ncbi:IS30 family transposase [Leuconostoc mesenteroides]|uniref:IS30 family transposase n=1 Tax=Leuconostoc mesenteroides TaxID=1245 RepID=UPI0039BD13F1
MTSLSSQERTVIQTLLELNYSVRAIARFIKRSPSTVSIEIHQVTPYKAEIAHALALKKLHLRGRHHTLTPAIAVFLNEHIGILKWSPETAAHVLGLPFKTIYNWLNAGRLKLSLADLPDKGSRQKRQSDGRRQVFVHGRSIETRPESVKTRQTFGHFEVDTMQSGKRRGDVLVTITERLSRQHIVRQVTGRNSQAVTPVLIRFFQGIKNAKSITVDRGREFAKYNEIEQKLGIPVYFAHPYSPEERGSNEILNRYVRRFIPKERKIETVSAKELDQINHWINARPMKTLNWQSPRKVFQQFAVFG